MPDTSQCGNPVKDVPCDLAKDLVAGGQEVLNDGGTDEAGGAGNKDAHAIVSIRVWMETHIGLYLSR